MPGLLDFAKMVQQLQSGGLLGNVVPVASKNNPLDRGINPLNTTEGAKPYSGGSNAMKFDWSPGGGTKVAKIGNTEITYGVGRNGTAELTLVKTPKAYRGQGSAREAVNRFLREADTQRLRVQLNADPMDAMTSKSRLARWYESLGFKRNAGRNKDFTTRAEYIRPPQGD